MRPETASTLRPARARQSRTHRRQTEGRPAPRTTPLLLAPAAAPRLPGLTGIEPAISVPPLAQVRLAALGEMLAHLGVLGGEDWRGDEDTPSDFLRNAGTRWTRVLRRDAPDTLSVQLTVRDWSDLLAHTHTEPRPRENAHAHMAVSIHSATCPVIPMRSVVKAWGLDGAALALHALQTGLESEHAVHVPESLEWVAQGWYEHIMEAAEDEHDFEMGQDRCNAFSDEYLLFQKIVEARPGSREAVLAALTSIPAGPPRRAAAALLTRRRRQFHAAATNRITEGDEYHEYGVVTPSVLLAWHPDQTVVEAHQEAMDHNNIHDFDARPQAVILIDSSSPRRLLAGLRRVRRAIRAMARAECLIAAMLAATRDAWIPSSPPDPTDP